MPIPTERATAAIMPTPVQSTVTSLPTLPVATASPQSTPTLTSLQQEWLSSVTEDSSGRWLVEGATFDQNSVTSFDPEYKAGNPPTFGPPGVGELHLRCYGEIKFKTGSTALIGLEWWSKVTPAQEEKIGWLGRDHMFILGGYIDDGNSIAEPQREHCLDIFSANIFTTQSTITIDLYSFSGNNPDGRTQILAEAADLEAAWNVLTPPIEFWRTGDVNLLPRLFGKPFLMIYDFRVQE